MNFWVNCGQIPDNDEICDLSFYLHIQELKFLGILDTTSVSP